MAANFHSTALQHSEAEAAKERDELLAEQAALEASRQEAERDIKELAGAIQAARELMAGTASGMHAKRAL